MSFTIIYCIDYCNSTFLCVFSVVVVIVIVKKKKKNGKRFNFFVFIEMRLDVLEQSLTEG